MDKEVNINEGIKRRLDILIALSLLKMSKKINLEMDLKEQIKLLSDMGLKTKEISIILGKTLTHISKELHLINKKKVICQKKK